MTSWAKFSREHLLAPNGLSVLRGILGVSLLYFLPFESLQWQFVSLAVFVVAAVTDYYDGYLARRFNMISDFGKFIDPLTDKILILTPLCVFASLGLISPWWVVPIAVREIVITFCRVGWMLEGKSIGAEKLGKWKFGFQVAAVSSVFLYRFSNSFKAEGAVAVFFYYLMVLMFIGALCLTVVSGVSFLIHNRSLFQSAGFPKFLSSVWVGLIPKAPGTWGTLVGIFLVWLTSWNLWLFLSAFVMLLWAGFWAVSRLDLQANHDPQFVVIDEVLGVMLALFLIPLTVGNVILAFLLFRVFDIMKPYPLRKLEKLPGYWGILCDDLGAGFYAWVVLRVILSFNHG